MLFWNSYKEEKNNYGNKLTLWTQVWFYILNVCCICWNIFFFIKSLAVFISNQKAFLEPLSFYFKWNNKYFDSIPALILIPTIVILNTFHHLLYKFQMPIEYKIAWILELFNWLYLFFFLLSFLQKYLLWIFGKLCTRYWGYYQKITS